MLSISEIKLEGYERVIKVSDSRFNAYGFVAVHNTTLGPSLGGCRIFNYTLPENAFSDCIALAKAMTYKSCLADVPHGGGKAVIAAESLAEGRKFLHEAMSYAVEYLNGTYIIAEDMGVSCDDLDPVREITRHVVRKEQGDPGPVTAEGVFISMKSAWNWLTGSDSLKGVKIIVQGLGSVGGSLVRLLYEEGADLVVNDIDQDRLADYVSNYNCKVIELDELETGNFEADIYAPCAIGGTVNTAVAENANVRAIVGSANNQLQRPSLAYRLLERGILYCPDFVVNAGGVIMVTANSEEESRRKVRKIGDTLVDILNKSKMMNEPTNKIALDEVRRRLRLVE